MDDESGAPVLQEAHECVGAIGRVRVLLARVVQLRARIMSQHGDSLDSMRSRLRRIAADRHVWAIRTREYQQVAEEVRRTWPSHTPERGVTLFAADEGGPEHEVVSIFGTVEEHHGAWSHHPRLDEVEVLGAEPTPDVRAELSGLGFTDIAPSGRGFIASRRH